MEREEHRTRGLRAAARFRGEEHANLIRAVIAAVFALSGHPWLALGMGCFVLAVATVVRSGETRAPLSYATAGADTLALAWGSLLEVSSTEQRGLVLSGTVAALAVLALLLSTLRLDPRLVGSVGVQAGLAVRAMEALNFGLFHDAARHAPHLASYAVLPAALGACLALIVHGLRRRREALLLNHDAPPVELAGYRDAAAPGSIGLLLCDICQAPVGPARTCRVCGADLEATPPVDASLVGARVLDPRRGLHLVSAAVSIATGVVLTCFAVLAQQPDSTIFALVSAAAFVVTALVPVLVYSRSLRSARGELLSVEGLPRPIVAMFGVVLALSFLVLVLTASGIVVGALCSGLALGIR